MKLTLDRLCISSRRLCPQCKKKVESGEAGDIDIEIGNILLNVAKSQKYLSNLSLSNIIETKHTIYLVVKSNDVGQLIRAGDHLLDQLKEYKDKDYVYIEKTKSAKKLLEDLLSPIVPVGTSTIMLPPDGEKELKVKIKASEKDKIEISSVELSQVTRAVLGLYAHYAYV